MQCCVMNEINVKFMTAHVLCAYKFTCTVAHNTTQINNNTYGFMYSLHSPDWTFRAEHMRVPQWTAEVMLIVYLFIQWICFSSSCRDYPRMIPIFCLMSFIRKTAGYFLVILQLHHTDVRTWFELVPNKYRTIDTLYFLSMQTYAI